MFRGCTSLVDVSTVLPALYISNRAYMYMFYGCTSLVTAPEIKATTLTSYACQYMF